MDVSSCYAKILGERNFQPREFPQSGSKAKDGEKKKEKTSWAEQGHTRDRLMAFPLFLCSFLSSYPFTSFFLFSFFPSFLLSFFPSFVFSFLSSFYFYFFTAKLQSISTLAGWSAGRSSQILMHSTAYPTGLSSGPSVATITCYNRLLKFILNLYLDAQVMASPISNNVTNVKY